MMAGFSFFNTTYNQILEQENIATFRQQLAEKSYYLNTANEKFRTSATLIDKLNAYIKNTEEKIDILTTDIEKCTCKQQETNLVQQKIMHQKEIEKIDIRLKDFVRRFNQLASDIQVLQNEINVITAQGEEIVSGLNML